MLQSYFVADERVDWISVPGKRLDVVAAAVWAHAPVAYGGLGVPGYYQQGMNAMGAATEEGMAILRGYATGNMDARRAYVRLVRRMLSPQKATDVLSAPLGGTAKYGAMVSNLLAKPVETALKKRMDAGKLSPVATTMMRLGNKDANTAFAERHVPVGSRTVMQEQVLVELARSVPMRPSRAFVGRFEKKRTLMFLLGGRPLARLRRDEIVRAKESFGTFEMMRC
jgi:hypothetical protein